ncbi:hypothetical protein [Nitrosomonas sp. JL21]|uniref:hypothetical protein n=1 Tax=Nitrosomonas sp. JL21 TaxID=153949 RepID=UPI00136CA104|nr:hypothetical protein [Nitrosomonas sp. JL21]MBL8498030.1 hypothetical protein [Nitrosomonas sp.]
MENKLTASNTLAIIRELTAIEAEDDRKQYIIDDLKSNNESQKTQIPIMRHRNEANELS